MLEEFIVMCFCILGGLTAGDAKDGDLHETKEGSEIGIKGLAVGVRSVRGW